MKDIDDYQRLAVRTRKPDPRNRAMMHCIMGMSGEVGELRECITDKDSGIMGEFGDCLWYSANLADLFGMSLTEVMNAEVVGGFIGWSLVDQLLVSAARLVEMAKKVEFYGQEYPIDATKNYLAMYVQALVRLIIFHEGSVETVAEANIKKLEKRYPELRFDEKKAVNRDYSAESEAASISIK